MLLRNFALKGFLCLNLYSYYIHIKDINLITVTLPQEIILVRAAKIFKHLSAVPGHLNTFKPKRISGCVTQTPSAFLHQRSFLFTLFFSLMANLSINWAVQEPEFILGASFRLQKFDIIRGVDRIQV